MKDTYRDIRARAARTRSELARMEPPPGGHLVLAVYRVGPDAVTRSCLPPLAQAALICQMARGWRRVLPGRCRRAWGWLRELPGALWDLRPWRRPRTAAPARP